MQLHIPQDVSIGFIHRLRFHKATDKIAYNIHIIFKQAANWYSLENRDITLNPARDEKAAWSNRSTCIWMHEHMNIQWYICLNKYLKHIAVLTEKTSNIKRVTSCNKFIGVYDSVSNQAIVVFPTNAVEMVALMKTIEDHVFIIMGPLSMYSLQKEWCHYK